MIKGAEKRGGKCTPRQSQRGNGREGELRQAQGSLVSGRKGAAAAVILIRLSVRTVHPIRPRERALEQSDVVTPGGTSTWLVAYNSRCRPRGAIYWRRGTLDGATEDGINRSLLRPGRNRDTTISKSPTLRALLHEDRRARREKNRQVIRRVQRVSQQRTFCSAPRRLNAAIKTNIAAD